MKMENIKKTGRSKGINAKAGQQVYTDEDIMQYLKELALTLGRVPIADDIRKDSNGVSFKTFYKRDPWSYKKWVIKTFGKHEAKRSRWGKTGEINKYSDDDLIQYLRQLSNKTGNKIPTSEDIRADKTGPSFRIWYYRKPYSLKKWLFKVFGKFDRKGNCKYTDEVLVELLKRYYREFGKVPTCTLLDSEESYPPGGTYTRRGGIGKFLKLAGFELNKINNYSEEFLIEKLQELAKQIGRTPTTGDLGKAHKENTIYPDPSTYFRVKSWKTWIELAGLSPIPLLKYTEEDLETALKKAGEIIGRAPTSKEFDAMEGFPSSSNYMKRGGWLNWLDRCELKYTPTNNFFGAKITTKDGHNVRSSEEAQIDDWLVDHSLIHFYEPYYPGQRRYKADFFVAGVYYEYCGLAGVHAKYDSRLQKKITYAKDNNIPLILIYRKDLDNLEKIFLK